MSRFFINNVFIFLFTVPMALAMPEQDRIAEGGFEVDMKKDDILITLKESGQKFTIVNPNMNSSVEYEVAIDTCQNLQYAGLNTGWRLTTVSDLEDLLENNYIYIKDNKGNNLNKPESKVWYMREDNIFSGKVGSREYNSSIEEYYRETSIQFDMFFNLAHRKSRSSGLGGEGSVPFKVYYGNRLAESVLDDVNTEINKPGFNDWFNEQNANHRQSFICTHP